MVWVDLRRSAVDQMRRVESEEQVRKTVGEVGCQAMEVMAATWPLQVEEGRGGKKKLAEGRLETEEERTNSVWRRSRMYMSPLLNSPL
jgi:hypothetical protein